MLAFVFMAGLILLDSAIAQSTNPPLEDVIAVRAGGEFGCAIVNTDTSATTGAVWCWGKNEYGQLGVNEEPADLGFSKIAVQVENGGDGFTNTKVDVLALGSDNACAIEEGELYCWGSNGFGKSGMAGDTAFNSKILAPKKVTLPTGATEWTAVTLGDEHSCGLVSTASANGVAYCWGHGDYLGNGALFTGSPPGAGFSSGPPTYQKSTPNAQDNPTPTLVVSTDTSVWNNSNSVSLGYPIFTDVANESFDMIVAGADHTCAVKTAGVEEGAYCWGQNARKQVNWIDYGLIWKPSKQVGDANANNSQGVAFDGTGISQVAAGSYNTCVVKNQSADSLTDAVFCWGQMANADGTPPFIAALDAGAGNPPVTGFSQIDVYRSGQLQSGRGMCGVKSGVLSCFGTGKASFISQETVEDLAPGEMVTNAGVTDLSMGGRATPNAQDLSCAVKDNRAFCWGSNNNSSGQLGNDSTTASADPVLVRQKLPDMEAPQNLMVTPGNGQLTVAFDAGNAFGRTITDYEYREWANPPPSNPNDSQYSWQSLGVAASPVIITSLSNGTAYTLQIRAVAGSDVSAPADLSGTPICAECPDPPFGLVVRTEADGTAKLFFEPPKDSTGITNYEYFLQGSGITSQWTPATPAQTEGPLEITGLQAGTTYGVKIRSAAGSLKSVETARKIFTVGGTNPPVITSVTTADQTITVKAELSELRNNDSLSSGPFGEIYSVSSNGTVSFVSGVQASGPDGDGVYTFTAIGLTNGQEYELAVAAFYTSGSTPLATSVRATPSAIVAPAAPTGLSVTAGDKEVVVSFSSGADGGAPITNYEYQLDGGAWATLNPADATSPITISGLSNDTQYSIKIRAVNSVGSGAESAAITATPESPAGPASKLAIAINGKVTGIDPQLSNLPFDVVVALTDKDGNAVENTTAASTITLTASGGTDATGRLAKVGALDQPVTATLAVGRKFVVINDLVYTGVSAEDGGDITLQASAASGLAGGKSGTSALFSVGEIVFSVDSDDNSIAADGQSTATITVTLTDADEVPQAGQNIRIETDKGTLLDGTTEVAATDLFPTDADGQVSFTLRAGTTAGKVNVTAFCPGDCPITLEMAFFSQQAVDAIKDFDASTDDAPSISDYEQAGVVGVDDNSIDPTNSVMDALPATDRDTPEKIQVVADLVNTILDVADGDADSVPTLDADDYATIGLDEIDEAEEVSLMNTVIAVQTPETLFPFEGLKGIAETVVDVISLADTGVDPELTVKRLSDAGLHSINASTLSAVVEAIKDATVTEVDTLTKLQGIVDGVVDAVVASTIGAFDEDTSANPPSADDYTNVGVTGVTTTTLPAINSIIGSLPAADRDSGSEVQAVVDVVNTILASADGDNTNLPALSADDYAAIGLSEVNTAEEVALMNAVLGSQPVSQVSTAGDLKAYASAVARTIQTAGGTLPADESPLTVADFALLGIEGVTEDNIDQVLETLADSGEGEITLASLQAVVEQTNAEQAGPAIPVPAMDLWAMVLLMLMVLWLMQRTLVGGGRSHQ